MRQADGVPPPLHRLSGSQHSIVTHTHTSTHTGTQAPHTRSLICIFMQLYATFCARVYGFLCARRSQPFFGGSTLEQLLHTPTSTVGRGDQSGSARVAHSMSLVTPNTNTLNVNNEVTHGTARHRARQQQWSNGHCTPCPVLPCLSSTRS